MTDDSGYFVTGKDTANKASIWKYLFSTPTSSSCQKLPNLSSSSAQLYLSPSTFFLLNSDPSTYNLNIYHLTFTHLSPNWSSSMPCSSGTCTVSLSESVFSSSSIYSFFIYGAGTQYLYFFKVLWIKRHYFIIKV